MKKYKRIGIRFLDEDACIQMLEQMARKGWFLNKAGDMFLEFRRDTPKQMHYYIDYNRNDPEYTQMLEDLGYRFIDARRTVRFYCSEQQLPVLQSDPILKRDLMLEEVFPERDIWLSALLLLLGAYQIRNMNEISLFSLFYSGAETLAGGIVLAAMFMVVLLIVQLIAVRKAVRKQAEGLPVRMKLLKGLSALTEISGMVLVSAIFAVYWYVYHHSLFLILYPLLVLASLWAGRTMLNRYIIPLSEHKKRLMRTFIVIAAVGIFRIIADSRLNEQKSSGRRTSLPLYTDTGVYPYDEEVNPWLERIDAYGSPSVPEEIVIECRSGTISDIVFSRLIRYGAYLKQTGSGPSFTMYGRTMTPDTVPERELPSEEDAQAMFIHTASKDTDIYTLEPASFNDNVISFESQEKQYRRSAALMRRGSRIIMVLGTPAQIAEILNFHLQSQM